MFASSVKQPSERSDTGTSPSTRADAHSSSTSSCRACRGLEPPSGRALPGAPKRRARPETHQGLGQSPFSLRFDDFRFGNGTCCNAVWTWSASMVNSPRRAALIQVADKRIHGTTCKQVAALFAEEGPHLGPLPATLFPCYQEPRRTVGRNSFVEVAKSFYEAPPEYIGRQVWVRWDGRVVRILNERCEQVQMHTRIEPGKFSRTLGTGGHSRPVVASCRYWVERLGLLGASCRQWPLCMNFRGRGSSAGSTT